MKIKLHKDQKGEYRWTLTADNGEDMALSSKGYNSKQSCKNAIDAIRKGLPATLVFDETGED